AGLRGGWMLRAAGAGGLWVAASPEHPGTSLPMPHLIWAAAGCAMLVAWPAGAWRRGPSVPWGLRPAVTAGAVAVLLALLAWFAAELVTGAGQAGLAQRIFGAPPAGWPLTVAGSWCSAAQARTRPARMPA